MEERRNVSRRTINKIMEVPSAWMSRRNKKNAEGRDLPPQENSVGRRWSFGFLPRDFLAAYEKETHQGKGERSPGLPKLLRAD